MNVERVFVSKEVKLHDRQIVESTQIRLKRKHNANLLSVSKLQEIRFDCFKIKDEPKRQKVEQMSESEKEMFLSKSTTFHFSHLLI